MASESKGIDMGKVWQGVQLLALAIGVYLVFKLLNKFNILGTSEATKQAEALGTDPAFANTVTNNISQGDNQFSRAIKQKFGAKPTKKQLDSLLPNLKNMPALQTQILNSHNNWTPNDAAKILGAYKQLHSQYEVNFFNTMFQLATKSDAYGMLDKLMHDSDMAKLREIVNEKPLI